MLVKNKIKDFFYYSIVVYHTLIIFPGGFYFFKIFFLLLCSTLIIHSHISLCLYSMMVSLIIIMWIMWNIFSIKKAINKYHSIDPPYTTRDWQFMNNVIKFILRIFFTTKKKLFLTEKKNFRSKKIKFRIFFYQNRCDQIKFLSF